MASSDKLGTEDPRAFSYFVAGLYAHRSGQAEGAAELYRKAVEIDPEYQKPVNNLGLLLMEDGTDRLAKKEVAPAIRLLEEAEELFRHAKSLGKHIAEYPFNLATVLSYRGRAAEKGERFAEARDLQRKSIETYYEAVKLLGKEPVSWVSQLTRLPVISSLIRAGRKKQSVERLKFAASVYFAVACSFALERRMSDSGAAGEEELLFVEMGEGIRKFEPSLSLDSRLDYNRACYYANAGRLPEALEILTRLRAVEPRVRHRVRSDPDLVDIPEIRALFDEGTPREWKATSPHSESEPA